MKVFNYKDWRYFNAVIAKAKTACQNSGIDDIDHFVVDNKMVEIGSGARREQKDYRLTRYACYLIAQNANPRLKIVALAQTYFAIQTRKQEISEKEYNLLTEDEKRFYQRNLTKKKEIIHLTKQPKRQESKTLINFIMQVIKDYTMEKQQMILLKKKDYDIEKIY